ncbi:MAG TPA: hypothetical protein VFY06_14025 [Verrucomicrobiae bacterium]|nr:hypothetical protein [Verrucomicrobiae bacterium]
MNADYEKQLESAVQHELNTLGELEAPPDIARRVMRVIEQRAAVPWYRRDWQTWPLALRTGSLAGLLAAFAFLCFEGSQLIRLAMGTPAAREVSGWFSLADAAWSAISALANALELAVRSVNPAVLIGVAVMLLFCYAACLGLGTIYWRLACARR